MSLASTPSPSSTSSTSSSAPAAAARQASIALDALVRPFTLSVGVLPWIDPEVDAIGHDPRSLYVERFWLGILGPSATWLLRRVAGRFDESPNGFSLSLPETARALGLSETGGRHSPFMRAFTRLVQFHMN